VEKDLLDANTITSVAFAGFARWWGPTDRYPARRVSHRAKQKHPTVVTHACVPRQVG
jgi:hypothetical protein